MKKKLMADYGFCFLSRSFSVKVQSVCDSLERWSFDLVLEHEYQLGQYYSNTECIAHYSLLVSRSSLCYHFIFNDFFVSLLLLLLYLFALRRSRCLSSHRHSWVFPLRYPYRILLCVCLSLNRDLDLGCRWFIKQISAKKWKIRARIELP